MNIVRWSPFRDTDGLFDRYQRLMRHPRFSGFDEELQGKEIDWRPSADISESSKHYLIKAELPEVRKEDVHVEVSDGMLMISGERRFEKEEETDTQHRIESMYGKFSRGFALPADVDEAGISAETKDGVLKVRLPKVEQQKAKTVEIAVD